MRDQAFIFESRKAAATRLAVTLIVEGELGLDTIVNVKTLR